MNSEDSAQHGSRKKLWADDAAIAALISASAIAILLCPCDCIAQNPRAILLVSLSVLFGVAAAAFIYRRLKRYTGITILLRALYAIAIAALAVYVEVDLAIDLVAWLARPH
ncbi:MAG: hypothetical protein WBC92_03420 [Terracidiphilus sp.]